MKNKNKINLKIDEGNIIALPSNKLIVVTPELIEKSQKKKQ